VIRHGATGISSSARSRTGGETPVFQRRSELERARSTTVDLGEEMAAIRAPLAEIFAACARTPGGFLHEPDRRGFYDVPRKRLRLWEQAL